MSFAAKGTPIFIDFTAAWCITCQVNERVALSDPAVRKAFAEEGVATLRADWTRQDASITRILEANGRAGVPMYLVYPKVGQDRRTQTANHLPQILTVETILHEIGSLAEASYIARMSDESTPSSIPDPMLRPASALVFVMLAVFGLPPKPVPRNQCRWSL